MERSGGGKWNRINVGVPEWSLGDKMKLILSLLIFATVCSAQTVITVTITVPAGSGPVAAAYLKTLCAAKDAVGTCIQPQFASVKEWVTDAVQSAVNAKLKEAQAWAVAQKDTSLPNPIKAALAAKDTAQATIDSASAVVADVK